MQIAEVLREQVPYFEDTMIASGYPWTPVVDQRNPYPDYARLRATVPVQRMPTTPDDGRPWFVLYRHADVVRVLRDHKAFSNAPSRRALEAMGPYVLVGLDEPAHLRYRNLVAGAFRPKMMARWQDTLVPEITGALVDRIVENGRSDLVREFNFILPVMVIVGVLGLPMEDFQKFQRWTNELLSWTDRQTAMRAGQELRAYYAPLIKARKLAPEEDIISEVVTATLNGDRLSDEEIYGFLFLLLTGGVETTYRAIGSTLFHLLSNPDQWDAVYKDRALIPMAIEEGLRMEAPLQANTRQAECDTEIDGVTIPAGAILVTMMSAANRDPAFIENPDHFDVFRKTSGHTTFGYGVHTCIGMHLARLEMRSAINILMDRLPNLRLDHEEANRIDAHIHGTTFRSPTALPVFWDP